MSAMTTLISKLSFCLSCWILSRGHSFLRSSIAPLPGSNPDLSLLEDSVGPLVSMSACHVLIGGEFNTDLSCPLSSSVTELITLMECFSLQQMVSEPSHLTTPTLLFWMCFFCSDLSFVKAIMIAPELSNSDHLFLWTVSLCSLDLTPIPSNKKCSFMTKLT